MICGLIKLTNTIRTTIVLLLCFYVHSLLPCQVVSVVTHFKNSYKIEL